MSTPGLPFLPQGFRFAPDNRLAVGLVARVGMFAGMLMTLRTVGLLFFYGRWGEGIVAGLLLGVLVYGLRRLHLGAAGVLLVAGPVFLWFAEFRFVHLFLVVAVPLVAYFAWAIRGVEGEARRVLLELH